MGLKARLEALNPNAPVVRFIDRIIKFCPIPPRPQIRGTTITYGYLKISRRKGEYIVLATMFMMILLILYGVIWGMVPIIIKESAPYPTGTYIPPGGLVIDRDFVLSTRAPPSTPQQVSGFWMEGNEKLVIRDCTVSVRSLIYLRGFANLTIINVRMVPYAVIYASDNAFVKMVNVTNWGTSWSGDATYLYLIYYGGVIARDNSRVWIENSRLAGTIKGITMNEWLAGVIKDSPNAEVTVLNTEFIGLGKTAVRLSQPITKTEFKWGEPISMTLRLENVGNETLNFFEIDHFYITAYEYGRETEESFTLYKYIPTLPEFRFPLKIEPGGAIVQTLTLRNDGSTPFSILRIEGPKVIHTNTWWNTSLEPGKYWIHGSINSRALSLSFGCGPKYVATISEEKWQG